MNGRFNRTKPVILLTGAFMVALGIAVLTNPLGAVESLTRIVGWILLACGVITVVPRLLQGKDTTNLVADIWIGIAGIVLGLILAIFPKATMSFIWTLIGILILVTGVLDIMEAGRFRQVQSPLGLPAMFSGALCVLLGVLVILVPLASPTLGMLVAAVALLINGVTEIIFGLGM